MADVAILVLVYEADGSAIVEAHEPGGAQFVGRGDRLAVRRGKAGREILCFLDEGRVSRAQERIRHALSRRRAVIGQDLQRDLVEFHDPISPFMPVSACKVQYQMAVGIHMPKEAPRNACGAIRLGHHRRSFEGLPDLHLLAQIERNARVSAVEVDLDLARRLGPAAHLCALGKLRFRTCRR